MKHCLFLALLLGCSQETICPTLNHKVDRVQYRLHNAECRMFCADHGLCSSVEEYSPDGVWYRCGDGVGTMAEDVK